MIIDTDSLDSLGDEDITVGLSILYTESKRRESLITAQVRIEEAARQWREAAGRVEGDEYVQPTGYHNAYQYDAVVTYGGKKWKSTRNGANGIPGQSPDWVQVAEEGEILEWVQPHAGSEYPVGAVVKHKGRLWRNDHVAVNGWEPGTVGSQWTDIGPA